jgi:hypothetical protein
VIESYQVFVEVHQSLAGFVAQDLVSWNYWDAGPDYATRLRFESPQHPASRYAMLSYLKQSPRPEAKATLGALAGAGQQAAGRAAMAVVPSSGQNADDGRIGQPHTISACRPTAACRRA